MNLLDMALQHQDAILAHAGLAAPDAVGKSLVIHATGNVRLVRRPGVIRLVMDGYPAEVPVWILDPNLATWRQHPRLTSWYATWSEHARIAYEMRRNHDREHAKQHA